jgi:hypothetical protein
MEASGQFNDPAAYAQGKEPYTHWIGGWVGPRDVLGSVVKRKILFIAPTRNRTPVVQSVA